MAETTCRISLLGEPTVEIGNRKVEVAKKQLGLISLVYCSRHQRLAREPLSKILWPGVGSSSARHSLSQALYVVRKKCPGLLRSDSTKIEAGKAVCDVAEFQAAVHEAEFVEASRLYQGPFLENFEIADSVEFAHWKDGQQETLTKMAEGLIEPLAFLEHWPELARLAGTLLQQGRHDRQVLSAYVTAARQSHADGVGEEDAIEDLPRDLAIRARRILDSLKRSDLTGQTATGGSSFVGRRSAVKKLTKLYEEGCRGGNPRLALIVGEAGVGKSALANRFCRVLALKGAKILMAKGHPAEENVPFGIIEQWLRDVPTQELTTLAQHPWMEVIRQVFPVAASEQPDQEPNRVGDIGYHRLIESTRRLVLEISKRKPLVLAVDDIHLADSASLGLIHYLFRRDPGGIAMVLATKRSEVARDQAGVINWPATQIVELVGLEPSEVRELVTVYDQPQDDLDEMAETLHRRTGGNPLLIKALLEETERPQSEALPPQSVVDFYRPRIFAQQASAQSLLAAAHLIGEPGNWERLAGIAGLSETEFWQAWRDLEGLDWVYLDGDVLKVRHGLLAQVAFSLMPAIERQRLHGRAARILAEEGRPSDALVAISHDIAGNKQDAYAAAVKAVEACEILHARSEKEFFLKLGLSNAPSESAACEMRIQLAELFLQQQQPREALEAVRRDLFADVSEDQQRRAELVRIKIECEMATTLDQLRDLWARAEGMRGRMNPLAMADTYVHLAGISHDLGFDKKSLEIAQQVAEELSNLPMTRESAQHLLRPIVIIGLNSIGYAGSLQNLAQLPKPDERDPVYACSFHSRRGSVRVAAARLVEAEKDFAESLGIAERYALFDHYFSIHNNAGVCLMEQGQYDEARSHLVAASDFADPERTPGHYWIVQDNLMILEYERGNLTRALEIAEAACRFKRTSTSSRAAISVQSIVGLCSLSLGAPARSKEAEREITFLLQQHEPVGNDMSYVHIFMARMKLFRNDTEGARGVLLDAARRYRSLNALAFARIQLELCRMLQRSGMQYETEINELRVLLRGSGAIPLIEGLESLAARA